MYLYEELWLEGKGRDMWMLWTGNIRLSQLNAAKQQGLYEYFGI